MPPSFELTHSHPLPHRALADGNVAAGEAIVQKLDLGQLTSSQPPTVAQVAWTYIRTDHSTFKAARSLSDGTVVGLMFNEQPGYLRQATLIRLTATGSLMWGPVGFGATHGEGTDVSKPHTHRTPHLSPCCSAAAADLSPRIAPHLNGCQIAVSKDEQSFVITGQGGAPPDGTLATSGYLKNTLSGRLTKVNLQGGWVWSKSFSSIDYSVGGSSSMIKNECWGVAAVDDGYIIGCGTGIEECNDQAPGQLGADCRDGTPDHRPGSYSRIAGIWQSEIVRTDLGGNVQWLRVDQYRANNAPPLGASFLRKSSASEFVLPTPDGGIVSINDEAGGVGLLKLGVEPRESPPQLPPPPPMPPFLPPIPRSPPLPPLPPTQPPPPGAPSNITMFLRSPTPPPRPPLSPPKPPLYSYEGYEEEGGSMLGNDAEMALEADSKAKEQNGFILRFVAIVGGFVAFIALGCLFWMVAYKRRLRREKALWADLKARAIRLDKASDEVILSAVSVAGKSLGRAATHAAGLIGITAGAAAPPAARPEVAGAVASTVIASTSMSPKGAEDDATRQAPALEASEDEVGDSESCQAEQDLVEAQPAQMPSSWNTVRKDVRGSPNFLDFVKKTPGTQQERAAASIAMGAAFGLEQQLARAESFPAMSTTKTSSPAPKVVAAPFEMPRTPLPASALDLLDELQLGKYKQRFVREDLTDVAMFASMLQLGESGAADLRTILREVGMTLGHRERMLLALSTRPRLPPP